MLLSKKNLILLEKLITEDKTVDWNKSALGIIAGSILSPVSWLFGKVKTGIKKQQLKGLALQWGLEYARVTTLVNQELGTDETEDTTVNTTIGDEIIDTIPTDEIVQDNGEPISVKDLDKDLLEKHIAFLKVVYNSVFKMKDWIIVNNVDGFKEIDNAIKENEFVDFINEDKIVNLLARLKSDKDKKIALDFNNALEVLSIFINTIKDNTFITKYGIKVIEDLKKEVDIALNAIKVLYTVYVSLLKFFGPVTKPEETTTPDAAVSTSGSSIDNDIKLLNTIKQILQQFNSWDKTKKPEIYSIKYTTIQQLLKTHINDFNTFVGNKEYQTKLNTPELKAQSVKYNQALTKLTLFINNLNASTKLTDFLNKISAKTLSNLNVIVIGKITNIDNIISVLTLLKKPAPVKEKYLFEAGVNPFKKNTKLVSGIPTRVEELMDIDTIKKLASIPNIKSKTGKLINYQKLDKLKYESEYLIDKTRVGVAKEKDLTTRTKVEGETTADLEREWNLWLKSVNDYFQGVVDVDAVIAKAQARVDNKTKQTVIAQQNELNNLQNMGFDEAVTNLSKLDIKKLYAFNVNIKGQNNKTLTNKYLLLSPTKVIINDADNDTYYWFKFFGFYEYSKKTNKIVRMNLFNDLARNKKIPNNFENIQNNYYVCFRNIRVTGKSVNMFVYSFKGKVFFNDDIYDNIDDQLANNIKQELDKDKVKDFTSSLKSWRTFGNTFTLLINNKFLVDTDNLKLYPGIELNDLTNDVNLDKAQKNHNKLINILNKNGI